jgi:hypothetical protein
MTQFALGLLMALSSFTVSCAESGNMDEVSKIRVTVAKALPLGRSANDVTTWLNDSKIDHSGLRPSPTQDGDGQVILAMMPSPDRDPNRPISIVFSFDTNDKLTNTKIERASSPL